jgi:hypothetical protein
MPKPFERARCPIASAQDRDFPVRPDVATKHVLDASQRRVGEDLPGRIPITGKDPASHGM